jgi:hypothetical protein
MIPAAASTLRDNHLLITGLWKGLTRLTNSHAIIIVATCHAFGCPVSKVPSFLEALKEAELACHDELCQISFSSFRNSKYINTDLASCFAPVQDLEPVIRNTETNRRQNALRKQQMLSLGLV